VNVGKMKISRRSALIGAGAAGAVAAQARPLRRIGGGGNITPTHSIPDISLENLSFTAQTGNAGAHVATATAILSPSGQFSGTWSLSPGSVFSIVPSTGVLKIGGTDVTTDGQYSVTIIATGSYTGSPFSKPFTLTATAGRLLSVDNTIGSRPLGPLQSVYGAPNDYPFATVKASITRGSPGNIKDYVQLFNTGLNAYVGVPWYLNDSSSPPISPIAGATIHIPSVPGTTWNPSNTDPPVNPLIHWRLRFISGGAPSGTAGQMLDDQPVTVDILKRSNPFFPSLGQVGFNNSSIVMITGITGGIVGGAGTCPIVSGVMTARFIFVANSGFFPDNNSVKARYTIDDIPVGPIVIGPISVANQQFNSNIDTTSPTILNGGPLSDGTHALGVILIDCTSTNVPSNAKPYFWRCIQFPFIVHNSGQTLEQIYAGPMVIPSCDSGHGPSFRLNTQKLDFVTFPGFDAIQRTGGPETGGTHNTVVPIPSPQSGFIPPASDRSSPLHGLTPDQQRDSTRWFTEGLGGATPTEYLVSPRFLTTMNGGAYVYGYNGETGQTIEGDYTGFIQHCNFDGPRNDNQTDQISGAIDGHDGTYWVVFEGFGRIIKVTFDGTVSTLAGGTTDRSKLGLCSDDGNSATNIDSVLIHVGRIGIPSFPNLRGINHGCWDLTDTTPGNTLIVANPIHHSIVKVTGLAPGHGPVTMTRIAGQDGGLGGRQVAFAGLNGGYQDGPATEFIAGTQVAHFVGNINSSGVLRIESGYTVDSGAGLVPGCPIKSYAGGNPNTSTGYLILAQIGSGSGNGTTWKTSVPITIASGTNFEVSQPVALLSGPYDVQMADGVRGPDPLGTLYVADQQNWAIRKISANLGTVSTLFGNQTNRGGWWSDSNGVSFTGNIGATFGGEIGTVNISTASWASNLLHITTGSAVTIAGIAGSDIKPYWTVKISGLTNDGSGGPAAINGYWQVARVASNTDFQLSVVQSAGVIGKIGGTGEATLTFYGDDVFVPSAPGARPLNHGQASEVYCPYPQSVAINSTGKLVIGSSWFNTVLTVDLAGTPSVTYTGQFGCTTPHSRLKGGVDPGSHANIAQRTLPGVNFANSWIQLDVDSGVAGDTSVTGCVGPKDDIIMLNSNGSITGYYWRFSGDGSWAGRISSNDMNRSFPLPVGRQGGGHYAWMIAMSRHQGRMLSSGLSDSGINSWRIINPAIEFYADASIQTHLNVDSGALTRGYHNALHGSCVQIGFGTTNIAGPFPWGLRPGITQTHGEIGRGNVGLPGHADTFDGVVNSYPTSAALGEFIKSGFGGTVPRPEFSIGGDDLNDIIYAVQRMSIQGSIPVAISGLVQRAPYAADVTAPVISNVSATRTGAGATTITVTWDTVGKATWGIVAAGFASAHGSSTPYHLYHPEAYVPGAGNLSYKTTSHSVTIDVFQDALTYLVVLAKDVAGNNAISAEQTVAA